MSLLEQFDYLRNHDAKKRLDATLRIFAILDIGSLPVQEINTLSDLKSNYGEDVHYTFTRLVRGLASSRESARLGFSAALSELLRALTLIDTTLVLDAIEKATIPGGNIKGQETRDYQFGRLFGLQALCTSGLLTRKDVSMDNITPVLVLLYELAMSKGWLRESCASVIIQVLESLSDAQSPVLEECADTILEMLYTSQLSKTMEGIAISLKCRQRGSKRDLSDWSHKEILHADNLSAINKIMRDLASSDGKEELQTGTWKPKLHFAWLVVIRAILTEQSPNHIKFADFWRIVVDEGLFSVNASHERKFWGLQLFNNLVDELPTDMIQTLFSPNFLRTLGNQISQNDRYLHKAAKNSTLAMVTAAQKQPNKALVQLKQLWDYNLFFDRLAKDKSCETLMLTVPAPEIGELLNVLIAHCNPTVSKVEVATKEVEKRRQFVADCILTLLRSSQVANDGPWVEEALDFFVVNGFFKVAKVKKGSFTFTPELTEVTRQVFQSRLQSALGLLMPTATSSEDAIYVQHVVQTVATYRNKKHHELILQPDETILARLESAEKKLEKLEKKRKHSKTQDQALAFILIYSLTVIQIYAGESDAVQVLEDLDGCYSQLFSKSKEAEESEQDPMEILVDLLLNFLSRESVLFRKLVESVFVVFAGKMTSASMTLLLNVLASDESGEALFDRNADEDDDDEEGENDEDGEEDEDMIDEDEAARASDSESNSEEDDDEEEDDAEGDAERDAALDAALAYALGGKKRKASDMNGSTPAGEGHESDFEADSEEEEDLMDDDQMLAMDATLENIFKRRKQESTSTKKKDRVDMKTSTIQFKRKVIDLLESFIKSCPSSPLILDLVLPLLQCARKSSDAPLTEKIQTLIRQKLTKSKTLPDSSSIENVLTLLASVHEEAERAGTPPQLTTCSQTSLFLVRLALSTDEQSMERVVRVYADTQLSWLSKKHSKLSTGFFVDFVNWCTQWRVNRYKKAKDAPLVVKDSQQNDNPLDKPKQSGKKQKKNKGGKSRGKTQ